MYGKGGDFFPDGMEHTGFRPSQRPSQPSGRIADLPKETWFKQTFIANNRNFCKVQETNSNATQGRNTLPEEVGISPPSEGIGCIFGVFE